MLFHNTYAAIPVETEIGGFWSFGLKDASGSEGPAAADETRLAVGLVGIKTKESRARVRVRR